MIVFMVVPEKKNPQDITPQKEDATQQWVPPQPTKAVPLDPFARLQQESKQVARPKQLKVTNQVKRGSKLSPRVFLLGCIGFMVVFLGLTYAGLYYAITSSEVLQSIGLEIDAVKNVLLVFARLLFWLVFLGGFYVLVLNIYRLITVKAKSKIKYALGVFLGFLLIMGTVIWGTISIQRIKSISGTNKVQTNLLVIPRIQTQDGQVLASDGIPLITPLKMKFQLNKEQFDKNILRQIGTANPISGYEVDCGNGQTISAGATINLWWTLWWYFGDHCLYTEKGEYLIKLTVYYTNRTTNQAQSSTFDVAMIPTQAAIQLTPNDDTPYRNDRKTEYIIGVAPVSVDFRAQLLFTDLGLADDTIIWDFDNDGIADLIDNAAFTYPFDESKLHTISYQLPGLQQYGDTWFTFDLRVVESELAQCTLDVQSLDNNKRYKFAPQFDEIVDVATYHYTIYDTSRDTMLENSNKVQDPTYSYTFEQWGSYQIQASYFTPEWLKWSCRSERLVVWFVGNQVDFTTRWRQSDDEPFVDAWEGRTVLVDQVNRKIAVTSIPVTLELSVDAVRPDPNADVKLYYDGRQLFADRDGVYEVPIAQLGKKDLERVVTTAQSKEDRQAYEVDISRSPLSATIIAEPMVGTDPFEVTLDASVSALYDEDDEIVFFTRDFWDGESRTNVSQWKIRHTYTYDLDADVGEYYPSVTVRTRKGFTDSYRLETPIVVKKALKEVDVSVDSHPTLQARVNDIVTYSVQTDGAIDRIEWDFGNGQAIWCDDRTCSSAPIRYTEPGTYKVRAEVFYQDDVPVVGRTTVRVY